METSEILKLYDYNYWANRRVMAGAAHASPEQFLAPTAQSFGSLRGTLAHILDSECGWRTLWQHNTIGSFEAIKEDTFPTFDALERRWNEEELAMRDYLAGLRDDDLSGHVRYTIETGQTRDRLLWHCLVHVVNHGTHHRSQAAAILRGYGHSPGELDFTVFLNENP